MSYTIVLNKRKRCQIRDNWCTIVVIIPNWWVKAHVSILGPGDLTRVDGSQRRRTNSASPCWLFGELHTSMSTHLSRERFWKGSIRRPSWVLKHGGHINYSGRFLGRCVTTSSLSRFRFKLFEWLIFIWIRCLIHLIKARLIKLSKTLIRLQSLIYLINQNLWNDRILKLRKIYSLIKISVIAPKNTIDILLLNRHLLTISFQKDSHLVSLNSYIICIIAFYNFKGLRRINLTNIASQILQVILHLDFLQKDSEESILDIKR